jgi:hypothetical protein
MFLDIFFRKDLELERKWWHRSAKILFVVLSYIILVGSFFVIYFEEESSAKRYNVVQNFSEFLKHEKYIVDHGCTGEKASAENGFNYRCFGGRILAPESFVSQKNLKNYYLGCLQDNGKIENLLEFTFIDGVACDKETGVNCTIPKNICNGNFSDIVMYDYEIRYGFKNYVFISLKAFGVLIGWVLFAYVVYYKGLIYIVFGDKKRNRD